MEVVSISDLVPTLCLNMIVKNESKIIERLLQSVLPVIDSYCICDTGSTDNTEELITSFFKKHNIPGKIVKEPFKNFEHNRNVALKSCVGMSDYVLLLDADMILQVNKFDKMKLKNKDFFYILQGNEAFYYQNTRIVKNNGLFSYAGVTHEYVNVPGGSSLERFNKDEIFILDVGDGGAKGDKYERDIRLLLGGIEENEKLPNKPLCDRYHFYLANTYHDSNQFEKAIEHYKKRIEIGGWEQEVWYSYYRIGLCYKKMDKIADGIYYWLNGYDYYQKRIENLYEVVNHYRWIGKHKLANLYYQMAKEIIKDPLDKDGYLFLHNDVYTYKLEFEYTIIACYLGIKNINDQIVSILNNSLESSINNNLLNNMKFYKDILKPLKLVDLSNMNSCDVNGEHTNFHSSSSCLINNKDKNGYLLNVRYVNYYINDRGYYLNCDKHIITRNKYVEMNKDLVIQKEKFFDLNFEDRRYIGVEDVRIFNDVETKDLLFIGTGFLKNGNIGIVKGNYDVNQEKLLSNEYKCSFSNADCEKNWVFVDYKKSTHVVYSWNPLRIGKLNETTNTLDLVDTKDTPRIFSHARGSSCGFTYHKTISGTIENLKISIELNEIWFVVHLVSYEQPRHYYHMFVVFDDQMNLLRYSAPFKFDETCIQYCLSLVVEDDRVLVNYSDWDRTTKVAIYDKKYIDSLLKYK
jgi:tetratricopeptide (TPR) repeat protein